MADDHYQTEYHLTPSGWVIGTARFFGHVQGKELPRPPDCVATFEHEIYQRSRWSGEERRWKRIWKAGHVDEAQIEILLRTYLPPK
jgi:hypothetical protein